jgi:hypothetical protein
MRLIQTDFLQFTLLKEDVIAQCLLYGVGGGDRGIVV